MTASAMTPETHWSLLLRATLNGSPEGQTALVELCRRYRPPVERYIRGRIADRDKHEDIAQSFFLKFLRMRLWKRADKSKGRFRSYLFTSVRNFLIEELRRETSGGEPLLSWESIVEEGGEPGVDADPGRHFDHEWAQQLLRLACDRLRESFENEPEWFAVLQQFLFGDAVAPKYAAVAQTLGIPEGTLRQRVNRTRGRLGLLFRMEVARTVEPHEVDEETAYLVGLLISPPPAI